MSGRQRESQLLYDRRAAVVECLAGNGDHPQLLVFGSRSDQRGEVLATFALPAFACHRAFEGQLLDDRIENEVRPRVVGPRVFAVEFLYEKSGDLFRRAAAESQLGVTQRDAAEQRVQIVRREFLVADHESYGFDSLGQQRVNAGVGLARALDFDRLQDQPVVVFLGSPDVRELAALRAEEPEPLEILGSVIRTDVESFRRFPYQLFLVVGSLEVRFDRLLPPFGRDRGKFGEKLLLFICHSVFD